MNFLKLLSCPDWDHGRGCENLVQHVARESPAQLMNHCDCGVGYHRRGSCQHKEGGWVVSTVTLNVAVAMTVTVAVVEVLGLAATLWGRN